MNNPGNKPTSNPADSPSERLLRDSKIEELLERYWKHNFSRRAMPLLINALLQAQDAKSFVLGVESGKKEQQEKALHECETCKQLTPQALAEAKKQGAREALEIIKEIKLHVSKYYRKIIIARVSCDEDWKRIQSKLAELEG